MSKETIRIFVGCDPNNCDLEQMMVLHYSIQKHSSQPFEITWMQLSHDPNSAWHSDQKTGSGWHTENWSTPFSGFRWAIPEFCTFRGRAIYMDADVIVLCDVAELWLHPMHDDAIVVAKGGSSSARLCTSVWDCEKARSYLPPLREIQADAASHKKLMQLIKERPQLIQPYLDSYNNIDGEDLPIERIKILHYSDMGTQFSHKYALPRLQATGQKHWFDGKILPHPRSELAALFDRYYQEAWDAGYRPEHYSVRPFGSFLKATQANYQGNRVTRPEKKATFLENTMKNIKNRLKKSPKFTLDD